MNTFRILLAVLAVGALSSACAHAQPVQGASGGAAITATNNVQVSGNGAAAQPKSNPNQAAVPASASFRELAVDRESGELTYVVDLPEPYSTASFTVDGKGAVSRFSVSMKNGDDVPSLNLSKDDWSKFFSDNVKPIKVSMQHSRNQMKFVRSTDNVAPIWEVAASMKRGGKSVIVVRKVNDKEGEGVEYDANDFAILPPKGTAFRLATMGGRIYPVQTWSLPDGKTQELITVDVK